MFSDIFRVELKFFHFRLELKTTLSLSFLVPISRRFYFVCLDLKNTISWAPNLRQLFSLYLLFGLEITIFPIFQTTDSFKYHFSSILLFCFPRSFFILSNCLYIRVNVTVSGVRNSCRQDAPITTNPK